MDVWAIADLHLAFGDPSKSMDVFGPKWEAYTDKIKDDWLSKVAKEDLVLIPGDISWAMHLEQAVVDLDWIDALPGTKVMIRGNHDYWWSSVSKVKKILPPSIHIIQNDAFNFNGMSIAGARLWDTGEFNFNDFIDFKENVKAAPKEKNPEEDQKIFLRELHRLELSLQCLDSHAKVRIAMTHYPPISSTLEPSLASALLEKYQVNVCVFGHLHNVKEEAKLFGEKNGIRYILSSSDFLDFQLVKVI